MSTITVSPWDIVRRIDTNEFKLKIVTYAAAILAIGSVATAVTLSSYPITTALITYPTTLGCSAIACAILGIRYDAIIEKDKLTLAPYQWTAEVREAITRVTRNGLELANLSEEFKDHYDIVLAAVTQNGIALYFASLDLSDNYDIVLAAVRQNGLALLYASENLKENINIVIEARRQIRARIRRLGENHNMADTVAHVAPNLLPPTRPLFYAEFQSEINKLQNKENLITLLTRIKPEHQEQAISSLKIVIPMLTELENAKSEQSAKDKETAWNLIGEGGIACGDRSNLYLNKLETLAYLRRATDLKGTEEIIVGSERSQLIHDIVAEEFRNYSENIEVALWAQIELHEQLGLPGTRPPQMRYKQTALGAFTDGENPPAPAGFRGEGGAGLYLKSLKDRIVEKTSSPEKRLAILCKSSHWVDRIKSLHPNPFKERKTKAEKLMGKLDNLQEQGQLEKEGDYINLANQIGDYSKASDLVEKCTREHLGVSSSEEAPEPKLPSVASSSSSSSS